MVRSRQGDVALQVFQLLFHVIHTEIQYQMDDSLAKRLGRLNHLLALGKPELFGAHVNRQAADGYVVMVYKIRFGFKALVIGVLHRFLQYLIIKRSVERKVIGRERIMYILGQSQVYQVALIVLYMVENNLRSE